MKPFLQFQREQLLKPLQLVMGAVDQKQAMPILSNVLLNVSEKKLSVTGTDLEIELIGQSAIGGENEPTRLTLPARKLFDICKALPENAAIELYQDKERITLTSQRSRFVMSSLPAQDFPAVETAESQISFTLSQNELAYLLQRTAFAMAQQDVRYYLNGMLMEIAENRLRLVATDGHRLSMNQTNIQNTQSAQVIIPYKAVMELMRLLKDSEKLLTVQIGHHHIRVLCDDFIFTSKLIEGRFPDYQRVIPKMGDKIIMVSRDNLKQALLRTAILSQDKIRAVRLEINQNRLKLLVNNSGQEAAEDEMDIEYVGAALDIGFNVTYLLDVLNVIKSDDIRLTFIDSNSSIRIDEPQSEGQSVFVVMPMRL